MLLLSIFLVIIQINRNYNIDLEIVRERLLFRYLDFEPNFERTGLGDNYDNEGIKLFSSSRKQAIEILDHDFVEAVVKLFRSMHGELVVYISNNQVHLAFDFLVKVKNKKQLDVNSTILDIQNRLKPVFDFIDTIGG